MFLAESNQKHCVLHGFYRSSLEVNTNASLHTWTPCSAGFFQEHGFMLISLAVGRGLSLPSYRSAVYDQVGLTAAPILLV